MFKTIFMIALALLVFPLSAQQNKNANKRKSQASHGKKTVQQQSGKKTPPPPGRKPQPPPPGGKPQPPPPPMEKLNPEQLEHLKIYKEISDAVSAGKVEPKKSFIMYYEAFATSGNELAKGNMEKSEDMKIKGDVALNDNKNELSQKYVDASNLFAKMATEAAKFPGLYKAGNKAKMDASIKAYMDSEAALKAMKARPCPRPWLAPKEAEMWMSRMNARNRKKQN